MKHQQGIQGLKTLQKGNCIKRKKKDGVEGMAEPSEMRKCECVLVFVCVRVCVCMHEHVSTGSPALAEL